MCDHRNFDAKVSVNRLEDAGRFTADVEINCAECGVPFKFIGLPIGLDMEGATVSFDGKEARLAIAPVGEVVPEFVGRCTGFSVRKDGIQGFDGIYR
jgi:hypothetical protein